MFITVAGNKKEVSDKITVTQLIVSEKVENPEYVSVSLNDDFVKSGDFNSTIINENDIVEFLYFMGGGTI
ncbi:sulfur carrier protein ThiS [[Clostridium] fimetarium]|uniref:Sulfur carrier protein n=1 Tax=[Clostridium] fimetarium TaxID=99656 RepID=A0A1I0PWL9_9FIRM|nr:sulfur carrier protein ThiS [[Clostridium] fimetarium]SEW18943.1 sulfur carrier protein [[Clostridium] fimetarium]